MLQCSIRVLLHYSSVTLSLLVVTNASHVHTTWTAASKYKHLNILWKLKVNSTQNIHLQILEVKFLQANCLFESDSVYSKSNLRQWHLHNGDDTDMDSPCNWHSLLDPISLLHHMHIACEWDPFYSEVAKIWGWLNCRKYTAEWKEQQTRTLWTKMLYWSSQLATLQKKTCLAYGSTLVAITNPSFPCT